MFEQKYKKAVEISNTAPSNKTKSGLAKLEAGPKQPRKLVGSIKINGRGGNVVVYLVRPATSPSPGAIAQTAAKISLQKPTAIPFLARLFNLAATKPTPKQPKASTAVRQLKVTTKKIVLPLAAKKSAKAVPKKQTTKKLQGKKASIKTTVKKISATKKATKKAPLKKTATKPTLMATTTTTTGDREEETVTVAETGLEDDTTEAMEATTVAPKTNKATTIKVTTIASEFDEAGLSEGDESPGKLQSKNLLRITQIFRKIKINAFFIY